MVRAGPSRAAQEEAGLGNLAREGDWGSAWPGGQATRGRKEGQCTYLSGVRWRLRGMAWKGREGERLPSLRSPDIYPQVLRNMGWV